MNELLHHAFASYNLIATVLLIFVLIYWIIVIVGVIEIDTIDVDVDLHTDVDVDLHADVDVDHEVEVSGGEGLTSVLAFFNIGQMPLMIFLSFLALPMWVMSILVNFYAGNTGFLLSLLFLIPIFIVSLFVAKILTTPIAKFYIKLKKDDEALNPIGKVGKINLPIRPTKIGQAEIKVNGTSVLINAYTKSTIELEKGSTVLVIEFDSNNNRYLVEPYTTI